MASYLNANMKPFFSKERHIDNVTDLSFFSSAPFTRFER